MSRTRAEKWKSLREVTALIWMGATRFVKVRLALALHEEVHKLYTVGGCLTGNMGTGRVSMVPYLGTNARRSCGLSSCCGVYEVLVQPVTWIGWRNLSPPVRLLVMESNLPPRGKAVVDGCGSNSGKIPQRHHPPSGLADWRCLGG